MHNDNPSSLTRNQARRWWIVATAGASACAVFFSMTFLAVAGGSEEIPPEVQKKTVSLSHSRVLAENFFIGNCGKCHKVPDPAKPVTLKSDCTSGIPEMGVTMVKDYVVGVQAGKNLYESYCGRCHKLIDPASHTSDYWSKNICTSDSCMVDRKLNNEEEEQVLLYLSSHSEKK